MLNSKQHAPHIGILGGGRIGRIHAKCLTTAGARVVTIADPVPGVAEQVAAECCIPHWTTDADEVLHDAEIDVVVICSPTPMHAAQVMEAAKHGKHIFCEKPIDLSIEVVDKAIKAVEEAGVKMMVGFNRRFDANFARVRHAIASDEIGSLTMLRITSRDPAPPPASYVAQSGGMFKDMTIHDFDMARFLAGEEVDEVFAMTQSRNTEIAAAGDIDTAVVLLKFKSGALGYIENSRDAAYGYDQRVEVLGSKGSVACDNQYPNSVVVSTGESVRRDLPLHFFLERYAEAYTREMQTFLHAIESEDGQVPVSGNDGREAMLLALAAEQSHKESRPIKMDDLRKQLLA